jgi:PleD family two-component response regulator
MTKVFTTGTAATASGLSRQVIIKAFDTGRLKGYRIPGSQDRRIPREYLIRFLKENGIPLGNLEDEHLAKVLIVTQDRLLTEDLKRELQPERAFKIAVAASGFDTGIQVEEFHPDAMIVDFSIGRAEALQICQKLRDNDSFSEAILVVLLPDDGSTLSYDHSVINERFRKPFSAALLAERLRTLIGATKELV